MSAAVATEFVTETFSLLHVTASATGGASNNSGVYNKLSSPTMTNVTATTTGGATNNHGVWNDNSFPLMINVTAIATGTSSFGVYNFASVPTIRGSAITGTTYSVFNSFSNAKIADSTLDGPTGIEGGGPGIGFTCVGVHNQDFVALSVTCA